MWAPHQVLLNGNDSRIIVIGWFCCNSFLHSSCDCRKNTVIVKNSGFSFPLFPGFSLSSLVQTLRGMNTAPPDTGGAVSLERSLTPSVFCCSGPYSGCSGCVCRPFSARSTLWFSQNALCNMSSSDIRGRAMSKCIFRFSSHSSSLVKAGLWVKKTGTSYFYWLVVKKCKWYLKYFFTSRNSVFKDNSFKDDWPFVCVQVTAHSSHREEGRRTIWRTIVLQEARHIQSKVHGPGEIVWVCIHSANDLKEARKWIDWIVKL